jgi:hypothetical protein
MTLLLRFVRLFGLINVFIAGAFGINLIGSLLFPGDGSVTQSLIFFGYEASIVPYTHMGLLVGCGQVVVLLLFGCALGLLAARFSKGLVDAPSKKTLTMSFVMGAIFGLLIFPSAGSFTSSTGGLSN